MFSANDQQIVVYQKFKICTTICTIFLVQRCVVPKKRRICTKTFWYTIIFGTRVLVYRKNDTYCMMYHIYRYFLVHIAICTKKMVRQVVHGRYFQNIVKTGTCRICTKNNGTSTVVYQKIGTYWSVLEIYRNLYHFFGTWFGTPTFLVHRHNFWSPEKTKKHEPAKHSNRKVHIRNAYYSRKYRINTILDRRFRPIFWCWNRFTPVQVTDLR